VRNRESVALAWHSRTPLLLCGDSVEKELRSVATDVQSVIIGDRRIRHHADAGLDASPLRRGDHVPRELVEREPAIW
jgi:hypothetical protein